MILGIIIGLFIGTGLGVLIMALLIVAKDENDQRKNGDWDYSNCIGCKHENLSAWEEPCDICHGQFYEPSNSKEE